MITVLFNVAAVIGFIAGIACLVIVAKWMRQNKKGK